MKLDDIVKKEVDIKDWKKKHKWVKRVLARLNALHRDAVQRMLALEAQIREAGGVPEVEIEVTWPELPEPEPEPPEEEEGP